ncbi:MAG: RNA polymerase sigma factor [Candidatus Promineifilaceae bacterium]|jgi:RNA polymerase sigma-70 factor (ECF subfamily)
MDEAALIKKAQNGDLAAFNRLVLAYQEAVYNVAYRIMGEPQSAEDATQEAFISAYNALKRFRGGSFKSWLMRIATNSCYDELRRRKRRPQTSLERITDENESFAFLRSPEDGPEQAQQRFELVRAIEDCLQSLPDDQRITAVLGDVEGFNYQEIAGMTGVSLGTVKSRMSRARVKLRDCLQGVKELLPASYRLTTDTR